jgi:hypothetical protein
MSCRNWTWSKYFDTIAEVNSAEQESLQRRAYKTLHHHFIKHLTYICLLFLFLLIAIVKTKLNLLLYLHKCISAASRVHIAFVSFYTTCCTMMNYGHIRVFGNLATIAQVWDLSIALAASFRGHCVSAWQGSGSQSRPQKFYPRIVAYHSHRRGSRSSRARCGEVCGLRVGSWRQAGSTAWREPVVALCIDFFFLF